MQKQIVGMSFIPKGIFIWLISDVRFISMLATKVLIAKLKNLIKPLGILFGGANSSRTLFTRLVFPTPLSPVIRYVPELLSLWVSIALRRLLISSLPIKFCDGD